MKTEYLHHLTIAGLARINTDTKHLDLTLLDERYSNSRALAQTSADLKEVVKVQNPKRKRAYKQLQDAVVDEGTANALSDFCSEVGLENFELGEFENVCNLVKDFS